MMPMLLLSGAVRAAVVLAAGLAAYGLLSRAAAATRRFVLVLTLGAAIVVPIAAAVGPRWTVQAPATLSVFARESDSESATGAGLATRRADVAPAASPHAGESSPVRWLDVTGAIALAWLAVAAALLARTVASQLRARTIVRRATPVEGAVWTEAARHAAAGRPLEIRVSAELDSPAVTGLFRPTIVVPRGALDWPVERCRLVVVHELAHVRRRDVLAQAIADVACAIHWCNPLVWVCARRLRIEREIAADDAVLAAGVRPSRYAEELLAVATSVAAPSAALAMAERTSLEARVASILASRLARAPLAARGTVAVVVACAVLAAAAACTSPVVSAPAGVTASGVAPRSGTANDTAIQRGADEEIAAIAAEWSPDVATVVVLDPATGEILANAGLSAGKPADVATTLAMPPGSTMKAITVTAALETRAITVDQKFDCGPDPRMYGDKELHDWGRAQGDLAYRGGAVDVAHLFAVSSNTGMSHIFDALGGENLALFIHRFHLGEAPGLPGAAAGAVPAHIVTGSFEGAMLATGAGGMTATPLQMIAAFGAIADDGVYHAPTLDRGGSTAERIFSSETARSVMSLLEAVVLDDKGTGVRARVDGVHVAGKTGTTEWTAPDGRDLTYASFIGVADLPSRRIVALVGIVARDMSGPDAAAPAFARLVKRIRGS
jgi:beta-lactamase regulating signal transducer with metallopeptidase domain